jgi:hypothetical protein
MRLGSDPEVFLQDANGKPISAIGYIMADKWNPLQIPDMPPGFTLQEDNVSLEYGVPPAATPEEWKANIHAVMEKSKEWLPGLSFSKLSCIIFPEDQMHHPLAHIFGCEPDFDAWTGRSNPKPKPTHEFMRSAGGHIHIETQLDPIQVVRNMDLVAGVPSVLMDHGEERKQLYGKAGAHRRKKYGVEYRTLSNFWIFEDKYLDWAWRASERALAQTEAGFDVSKYATRILAAINDNDKKVAQELVDEFALEVV